MYFAISSPLALAPLPVTDGSGGVDLIPTLTLERRSSENIINDITAVRPTSERDTSIPLFIQFENVWT